MLADMSRTRPIRVCKYLLLKYIKARGKKNLPHISSPSRLVIGCFAKEVVVAVCVLCQCGRGGGGRVEDMFDL